MPWVEEIPENIFEFAAAATYSDFLSLSKLNSEAAGLSFLNYYQHKCLF